VGERSAGRYGEWGAGAGATECHPAADTGVRAPRGGRALPWLDAARARAGVGKGTVRTQAGPEVLAGRKRGVGRVTLKNPFSFINKFTYFLNHFKLNFWRGKGHFQKLTSKQKLFKI
jgi:hypothetical protein